MKKILNPYAERDDYNCFGCCPTNENGLQLEFWEDGDFVVSEWEPKFHLQGYKNVLHGGIQATLMDEIASWAVNIKLKTGGVTSKMEVKYKRPVLMDQGPIKLRGKIKEMNKNIANVNVELINSAGKVCSEGFIYYFTFNKDDAAKKLNLPEYKKFFKEEEV